MDEIFVTMDEQLEDMAEEICATMDDELCPNTDENLPGDPKVVVPEASESFLLGKCAASIEEAHELYNNYAYTKGFGTRFHNVRKVYSTGEIKGREIVCSKQGFKRQPGAVGKHFTKLNLRTGCKAMIFFEKKGDELWEVTKHNMVHNHVLCPRDKVYQLKSHRKINANILKILRDLVDSGIDIADAFRFLKAQAGGSPALGFSKKDAYNKLGADKLKFIDGCDARTLMNIFAKRRESEDDFYFAFELDEEARLVSFFWRDKLMKQDYITFGKLLIHDTTYRTNKYKMICAPFVGINQHGNNCMFACGFILNERIDSFVWLFNQFLQSMDGLQPKTVMTDQAFSMAAAIKEVFPNAKHKLCTWHILKNSKKNIPHLIGLPGFEVLFNQVLMYCDTIDEFNHFWSRLVTEYQCAEHPWMLRLWNSREKWCSAFTKDRFSGGLLSSQRSESTNNSVSRKLHKTTSLHDFYKCFCGFIAEWRSNEKQEDGRCSNGYPEAAIPNVSILVQVSKIYTIKTFVIFQDNWLSSLSCRHNRDVDYGNWGSFVVWKPSSELFAHVVRVNLQSSKSNCTCKQFEEVGILCSHVLKVYFIMGVDNIPEMYIVHRWTRAAMKPSEEGDNSSRPKVSESSTIWTMTMQRLWNGLLHASSGNLDARRVCKEAFDKAKNTIEDQLGPIGGEDAEVVGTPQLEDINIRNLEGARTPGARNARRKSTREIISNRLRTRKKIVKQYTPSASDHPLLIVFGQLQTQGPILTSIAHHNLHLAA